MRRIAVADPKVEQPTLQRLYLTPSCMTARDGEGHALELLAEVIGGGATSFLYRQLVLELGVAVNAGAWYMGSAMDDTRFAVYAVPAEGVSLEALEEHVDRVLRRAAEALEPEAIERAKIRLVAETVYSSDSQSSLSPMAHRQRGRDPRPARRGGRALPRARPLGDRLPHQGPRPRRFGGLTRIPAIARAAERGGADS